MYRIEMLEAKTFKELKEIGQQINVLPAGDRRQRQTWIDAIGSVNFLLLEVSPAAEVQPIEQVAETSPGVDVDSVQDIINQTWTSWEKEYCAWLKGSEWCVHKGENKRILAFLPLSKTLRLEGMKKGSEYCAIWEVSEPTYDFSGFPLSVCSSLYAQKLFEQAAESSPGVEVDRVSEPIEVQAQSHKFLLCLKEGHNTLWYDGKNFVCEKWSAKSYCKRGVGSAKHQLRCHPEVKRLGNLQVVENSPADHKPIEVQATEPIEQAVKTSPGVEVDRVSEPIVETVKTSGVEDQLDDVCPKCSECFGDGYIEDEFGLIKSCFCSSEPKLSRQSVQSAIAPATKISTDVDQSPILMGIPLSDRFVARYTPPQPDDIRFQVEADGQLILLDFEVLTKPEPPDPDDFESLDAFREAIAIWDAQNPELFAVSMDSMCEWAPCPDEWYEPKAEILPLKASSTIELPEQSEVMELLLADKSSDTSDFFIPTFDRLGDRPNRSDEPPDTGIFARLPKPRPPNFPSQASQPKSVRHPETIPKLY